MEFHDPAIAAPEPPPLLARVRERIRFKHYSLRTEQAYVEWIRRFILFHNKRHPSELGAIEVEAFLTDLAVTHEVSASTQNQAKSAILFLYKEILGVELPWLDGIQSAKRPVRLPVILTTTEVNRLLRQLHGVHHLIGRLLYGSGMRILEAMRLRVKDVEFVRHEIIVRDGKGAKDRITMLPNGLARPLEIHLRKVAEIHKRDLADGLRNVHLPYAIARKYPNAGRSWGWQYVFPPFPARSIREWAVSIATTWATRHFNGRCGRRCATRGSTSQLRRIRSAIRSRHTCSNRATTFGLSRSYSVTRTSPRR